MTPVASPAFLVVGTGATAARGRGGAAWFRDEVSSTSQGIVALWLSERLKAQDVHLTFLVFLFRFPWAKSWLSALVEWVTWGDIQ
mmetsp:Transcript_28814/g.65424  ORF Transcript_28814/g.65424 Transcript_28814/m.65424 type:complete len:85 (+) Transcript_28814:15-269(+)